MTKTLLRRQSQFLPMNKAPCRRRICTAVYPRGSAAQRAKVHYDALGGQLPVGVEAVEGDERELDVAPGRWKAEELADVFSASSTFDHDLRVREVLLIHDISKATERAGCGAHSEVAVRQADGCVAGKRLAVVEHHGILGERTHDPLQIVVILGSVVRVHERSSSFAFSVVGHGHSFHKFDWIIRLRRPPELQGLNLSFCRNAPRVWASSGAARIC